MSFITTETKLANIITSDPNVITVFNRFGINLGVGDESVATICEKHNLNSDFFVAILNTFMHESYFPENMIKSIDVTNVVKYLKQTNLYYKHFQIPNIERHFNLLMSKSGCENNLEFIYKFFVSLKKELIQYIENDTDALFPAIIDNIKGIASLQLSDIGNNINQDDSIEQKITDLKNMFIIHLTGEYDTNLCNAVLFAIISLEKDIRQNNRIRSRLLLPYLDSIIS